MLHHSVQKCKKVQKSAKKCKKAGKKNDLAVAQSPTGENHQNKYLKYLK